MAGVGNPALFEKFCSYSQESRLQPKGNPDFARLAAVFWKGQGQKGTSAIEEDLRRELEALSQLPRQLHSTISNQGLLTEIDPWLTKLGDQGKAGLLALRYLELPPSDPQRAEIRQQLKSRLENLKRNPLRIGNEIVEFADQALEH